MRGLAPVPVAAWAHLASPRCRLRRQGGPGGAGGRRHGGRALGQGNARPAYVQHAAHAAGTMKRDALNAIAIAYDRCEASERGHSTPQPSCQTKPASPCHACFPRNGRAQQRWHQAQVEPGARVRAARRVRPGAMTFHTIHMIGSRLFSHNPCAVLRTESKVGFVCAMTVYRCGA